MNAAARTSGAPAGGSGGGGGAPAAAAGSPSVDKVNPIAAVAPMPAGTEGQGTDRRDGAVAAAAAGEARATVTTSPVHATRDDAAALVRPDSAPRRGARVGRLPSEFLLTEIAVGPATPGERSRAQPPRRGVVGSSVALEA
jgi:hypothetical protein